MCNCRELWVRLFHSVNLVPCPAPVTVGDLPSGCSVSTIFMLKHFRILELARGCLVTLIATPLLERQTLMLVMGILCGNWTSSLTFYFVSTLITWIVLISPSFCCRRGWSVLPRMMGRLIGVRSLSSVASGECGVVGFLHDTRASGWIAGCLFQFFVRDRVPLPLMGPGNFSWTLMKAALMIKTSPF